MKLAHIGIAVRSLDESVPVFEKIFNTKASSAEFVADQKVRVRKFRIENCDIELLEGTDPESPVTKFIEKRGEGVHHISFGTDDIEAVLKKIGMSGIKLIDETPKTGADDMLIAFLHPKSTGNILIELTQQKK